MWINAKNGGYEVTDIAKNGAASEAGMVIGDIITAIDGKPARPEQLSDARQTFRARPAGTKVILTVQRGGVSHAVTLTLKNQI